MEISKGMYIRFNGFISKIGHINISKKGNTYVQFKQPNGLLTHTRIENIDKASFNIIDLIGFGDIVKTPKGKFEVGYVDNNVIYTLDSKIIACLRTDEHLCFENKIINSIITKEQFNACKYVVERDK